MTKYSYYVIIYVFGGDMIDLSTVIEIIAGVIIIGGAIVGFFVMQKGQNMKIEQLQKDIDALKKKQTESTAHQIDTEKDLVAINVKLDHILEAIEDLKNGKP